MTVTKTQDAKAKDAFRSIGEAAAELELQPHILRYWESKFPTLINPVKRPDGRRLFGADDIAALEAVKILVHGNGLTLKGARALLNEQGVEAVLNGEAVIASPPPKPVSAASKRFAKPAKSPARALQQSVEHAFSAAGEVNRLNADCVKRLESVLAEMSDVKARLDAVRLKKAA